MSFVDQAIKTLRSNASLRKGNNYFQTRGKGILKEQRTGSTLSKVGVNREGYAQTKERKALMYKKSVLNMIIALVSITAIAILTIYFMY